jgi:beta-lactamase class A
MSRAAPPGQAGPRGRRPDSIVPAGHSGASGAQPLAHFPAPPAPRTCSAHAALLAALRPVLRHRTGMLAVGVADPGTGVTASYRSRQAFHTASIVKADILATLLLQ